MRCSRNDSVGIALRHLVSLLSNNFVNFQVTWRDISSLHATVLTTTLIAFTSNLKIQHLSLDTIIIFLCRKTKHSSNRWLKKNSWRKWTKRRIWLLNWLRFNWQPPPISFGGARARFTRLAVIAWFGCICRARHLANV